MTAAKGVFCSGCGKQALVCVCAAIEPVDPRHGLLILQHPQEQDELLGTAGLLLRQIQGARLSVGLSWPNLATALERSRPAGSSGGPDRRTPAEAAGWGVLHLGSAKGATEPTHDRLLALDKQGVPLADQARSRDGLQGLIVLDGSWSEAKSLWWRNPWLLRCRRFMVVPRGRSRYGTLRREPRREALSTIEAAAIALAALAGDPALEHRINAPFLALLAKVRQVGAPTVAPDAATPAGLPITPLEQPVRTAAPRRPPGRSDRRRVPGRR